MTLGFLEFHPPPIRLPKFFVFPDRLREIKSEDDFIISFSPALHLTKKLRWISVAGSAGVQISQYLKNDDKVTLSL